MSSTTGRRLRDESVGRLATRLEEEIGKLDVLVNYAAAYVGWSEPALTAEPNATHDVLDVNLFGARRVCQALLSLLRRSEHGRTLTCRAGLVYTEIFSSGRRRTAAPGPATASPERR